MRFTMARMALAAALLVGEAASAVDWALSAQPYASGGLFTNPLLPQEGAPVTITVRAQCAGADAAGGAVQAKLAISDAKGQRVATEMLALAPIAAAAGGPSHAEASWQWAAGGAGLYRLRVEVDPANTVAETDETNNAAELVLPVVVKGAVLHFPWYSEPPAARWATCITSSKGEAQARLAERGVIPLNWEYGGMSWDYYDKEKAKSAPEAVLADLDKVFYEKYAAPAEVFGFGIDEVGGYPGTWKFNASIASLKGLVKAKAENPDRFFAVWSGGGLRPEIAALCRQGADLMLLETYLWRAAPDELGAQDVYAALSARIDPYVRALDMFEPAYGNHCYALAALDTSERPDRIDAGELEQVVRFIRRQYPEMRGIACYNGGYGGQGLQRTAETDAHHATILAKADDLCFEYWIKPCITLARESLWLTQESERRWALAVRLTNLGAMDSGEVVVAILVDGEEAAAVSCARVPAGRGRNASSAVLRAPVAFDPGSHVMEARIESAPGSTVLDPVARLERYVP